MRDEKVGKKMYHKSERVVRRNSRFPSRR